jgi:hypothetical protein
LGSQSRDLATDYRAAQTKVKAKNARFEAKCKADEVVENATTSAATQEGDMYVPVLVGQS